MKATTKRNPDPVGWESQKVGGERFEPAKSGDVSRAIPLFLLSLSGIEALSTDRSHFILWFSKFCRAVRP
jgi:hypothetical protein